MLFQECTRFQNISYCQVDMIEPHGFLLEQWIGFTTLIQANELTVNCLGHYSP